MSAPVFLNTKKASSGSVKFRNEYIPYSKVSKPKIKDGHLQVIATMKAADQEPGIPGSFSYQKTLILWAFAGRWAKFHKLENVRKLYNDII